MYLENEMPPLVFHLFYIVLIYQLFPEVVDNKDSVTFNDSYESLYHHHFVH